MPNWSSGNIFAKCEQVFRPEGSKYCRFCKCYVPNDTPSWQQHTQGSGHTKAKSEHLRKLGRDVAAKKNEETNKEQMLHDMEEQALEDYKEKDIAESRDFTAKLYNNEPLPGTEQYVDRPEPPRKKRGAVGNKEEKEVLKLSGRTVFTLGCRARLKLTTFGIKLQGPQSNSKTSAW